LRFSGTGHNVILIQANVISARLSVTEAATEEDVLNPAG